jgi:REP element-mobilizing transposase RayT
MKEYQSLSHTRWDCKYHVVFYRSVERKLFMERCVSISVKYFVNWHSKENVM